MVQLSPRLVHYHFTTVVDPAKLHYLQSLPYFSLTPAVPTLSSDLASVDSRCPPASPQNSMHPYLFVSDTTPFGHMMSFKNLLQEVL